MKRDLEKLPSIFFTLLLLSVFFGYMLYDPKTGSIKLPLERYSESWPMLAQFILGFLVYCYAFLSPFALYGALKVRNRFVHCWIASVLIIGLWPPIYPLPTPPLWFRWIIFLVYPMSIYFTEGVYHTLTSKKEDTPRSVKIFAEILIAFIILSAGYYLVAPPEKAFPYFSDYNPYKAYIQSSMLQSTIPISDVDDVVAALDWISGNVDGGCVLVLHEAFYPWSLLRGGVKCEVMRVVERGLTKPVKKTFADQLIKISRKLLDNGKAIYTIWWVKGKGWYNVLSLPSCFKQLVSYGHIAVYT